MKTLYKTTLLAGLSLAISNFHPVQGATLVVSDNYNVTGSGSGFALNAGVNTGINPPTTRLTGTAAPGLRYINTGTKATTAYTITGNKLQVAVASNPGRFVLSANGTTAFDFGPALGIGAASPGSPEVYDLSISMKNNSTDTQRFSFALGTAEGDATTWDFGFQVYRNAAGDNFYTIGKRIDTGASGLGSDLNSAILTMGAGTFGTEITVLMRVTDAGAETTTFNSRVQLSLNGGSTWFYDTATDANLTNGWRLDGAGRIIMMDIAPGSGNVTFDNFSLNWNSGPRTWSGAGANGNWSNATNWGGATPVNGSALIFNGTTRQVNTNDLTGLTVPKVIFNNGGFTLYGNTFTNSGTGITNLAGNNILKAGLSWSSTAAKTWNVASGSELMLSNTTTIGVIGDHSVVGGGTLRTKGTMNFTANPVFAVNEGKHIVDGGIINTIGGYRIGSQATGAGAQTILTNGASLTITATGGTMRVGDSANPVTARLDMDSSTLTLTGGVLLAVPYATGAIGTVTQTGGTVSPGVLSFNEGGAGTGSYTVKNGTLITKQIRENTPAGLASIFFDNATLRTDTGAVSAFMTGLDLAQISTGGLSFDVLSDITVGQALSGTGALTKTGSAVLQLTGTGANTYSGVTTVNAGTLLLAKTAGVNAIPGNVTVGDGTGGAGADILRLGAANQIPDTMAVTISASGLFDLNGFSETVASVSSASSTGQIALGAGTLTTGDAGAANYAGSISGTGSLVKQGAGTLTLSGASTYSGTTTINAGKIILAAGGSIANSTNYALGNGTALDVSAVTFSVGSGGTISCLSSHGNGDVIGNVTLASGAQYIAQANGPGGLSGKLAVSGNLTLNNNTIKVNVTGGALGAGTYAILTYGGTKTGSFNATPVITGSGLASGLAATIQQSGGLVSLYVYNPTASNTVFRVMTYNIHSAIGPDGTVNTKIISDFITNQNVDLVGLNEVARFMARDNGRDIITELSQQTGMAFVFSNDDTSLTGNDQFGDAILSRYPILFRDHRFLPKVGDDEQRGMTKAIVDVKGKFLSFWVTHLDQHADNTDRLMSGTNLNTWLADEVFPVIMTGDFNDTPDSPIYNLMEQKWDDIWPIAGDGSLGRTVPCPGPPFNARIDYIWKAGSAKVTPTNAFVGYSVEGSDHYPALTQFILDIATNYASGFYLRCDEGSGTNVADSVGGLKGTLGTGAPTWSTSSPSGQPGDSSLFFNGNKMLTVSDPKQIIGTNGANDSYTLQTWVKVAVNYAPADRAIMFQYDRKPGFSFSINTNRTLHTTTFKIQDIPSAATLPNDGLWHHVAVVHTDGANMKFYIDAVLAATVAYTGGAGYRTSDEITVGSDTDGANPFTGNLARIKFDNRALAPADFDFPAVPAQLAGPGGPMDFATWKAQYGITNDNGDADGDGQSDFAEYIAGTNPTDASSSLRMLEARPDADGVALSWTSVGGIRYRIQYTDKLTNRFVDIVRDASLETDSRPNGVAGVQSFTDTAAPQNATRYYRVKVVH